MPRWIPWIRVALLAGIPSFETAGVSASWARRRTRKADGVDTRTLLAVQQFLRPPHRSFRPRSPRWSCGYPAHPPRARPGERRAVDQRRGELASVEISESRYALNANVGGSPRSSSPPLVLAFFPAPPYGRCSTITHGRGGADAPPGRGCWLIGGLSGSCSAGTYRRRRRRRSP